LLPLLLLLSGAAPLLLLRRVLLVRAVFSTIRCTATSKLSASSSRDPYTTSML
jgi:hypothetical protein